MILFYSAKSGEQLVNVVLHVFAFGSVGKRCDHVLLVAQVLVSVKDLGFGKADQNNLLWCLVIPNRSVILCAHI